MEVLANDSQTVATGRIDCHAGAGGEYRGAVAHLPVYGHRPCHALGVARSYAKQSQASRTDFLRRLHAAARMRIEKLLTDNGNQFTDRFTTQSKKPSGERTAARVGESEHQVGAGHRLAYLQRSARERENVLDA